MSNIGKLKILLPSTLTIKKTNFDLKYYTLVFIGPLGTISINLPQYINIVIIDNSITLESINKVMWGTTRNLIHQAIIGVTAGYTKKLELIGIGYKVSFADNILSFSLGMSHPINIPVIKDIKVTQVNSTTIVASSISNSLLSSFLHSIRLIKPASKDHYKGKGINITN
jgi:large subunit ribosomal protein L6